MSIRGDGKVSAIMGAFGSSGLTTQAGLTVTTLGVQVVSGTNVFTHDANADTLSLKNSLSSGFGSDVLYLETAMAGANTFNMIKVRIA
jgi:hypothetical protein